MVRKEVVSELLQPFTGDFFEELNDITPQIHIRKGLINLAMAGPQEIFEKHLITNEEQPSFSKTYSAHFGGVSTM